MAYLSAHQVAHYAYEAGFRGSSLVTAVAIADSESSFNSTAVNPDHSCFGLWQISDSNRGAQPDLLFHPLDNARMAYFISDGGFNWSAWTSFDSGSYKQFLGIAEHSVLEVEQSAHFPRINVRVDGQPFMAVEVGNSTYMLWTILAKWGIPYKYLGNGKFSIDGRKVKGFVYKGSSYIKWRSIPNIQVNKVNGEFNFTESR
ncbi:transglycosylase SLT domain-containing protein [Alicyclobacillus tolerans]|uniref:Transglycosylase SLT domain-containing protein n=2 Tax=Alicyclobacillus tolerans TaxID=90970 RepID=A0A1M6TZX6_9BACL|nr:MULTISPECIES: transglycosylase SLT domain-containing protein [Alicyclobacillus]MDP9727933.1 hypothetical protein [Alicyclobacillus tengchongensis]QRF24232.1 transglycosylase SLT domain-containing protein [Alicyclobacillus sp. TC]SHK62471.1 Transglycosylase SLT domain-containing protein [Alicyclobacillus montanus]